MKFFAIALILVSQIGWAETLDVGSELSVKETIGETIAAPEAEKIEKIAVEAPKSEEAITEATTLLKTKEADIPVVLEKSAKSNSEGGIFQRIGMALIIGLALIGAGIIAYRKMWKRAGDQIRNTQIKILSQHHFGPKKSVAMIRVAGETMLVGLTDHNVTLIKSLALLDEDIPEETPSKFSSVFAAQDRINDFKSDFKSEIKEDDGEAFSISSIKDVVSSKLKNMRTLE